MFASLSWKTANGYSENTFDCLVTGRETFTEVVLKPRLHASLLRLNPELPVETLDLAIEELTRDRSTLTLVQANREIHELLKNGVKVSFQDKEKRERIETVRIIDWSHLTNNDFFLVSQFWVTGDLYKRRPDLVGFVNGIPLVFIELKAVHRRLKDAYDGNLRDYKDTIPHIFWYNAFIIISNGTESRIGSISSPWEQFTEWKRINTEGEKGSVSLETIIRGTCEPTRLLDIVENFILFQEAMGGTRKVVARCHQYLGVNNAIEAVMALKENKGRLGVFWHTQGSGKSFSMVFFCQKVLRKISGNWSFVIVTDRVFLDDQIYKTFASVGAVIEDEKRVRAQSGVHLKQLLREDHRYLFTLIHKFGTENGKPYPKLSDRSDIIVITDEAHRSQYDILAANMRRALPNAAFLGFTGTPLMAGEEKTREVFGEYVSIYNFRQSVEDQATVPLYYENRIPELQLTNEQFSEDMEALLEDAELDPDQEAKVEREFSREYHLITRDDRLEKIAEDIVSHFMGRGFPGKAMVISIDRITAVRMYEKVQKYWHQEITRLEAELESLRSSGVQDNSTEELAELRQRISYMKETDMAVVISQSQNEVDDFRQKGIDIIPHRRRMVTEDLDVKFKNPDDPFRIVFVCAMWITGFDAPSCSTIYLDKPLRNHTLMQTIARANRVFGEKHKGLIVDYIGIFRSLQKALAIYGSASGGGVREGDMPVEVKDALVTELETAIAEAQAFCESHSVDLGQIIDSRDFERLRLLGDATESVIENDESKRQFLSLAAKVDRLFKAILPDPNATEYYPVRKLLVVLAKRIRSLTPEADISDFMGRVEELLDRSVAAESYIIRAAEGTPIGIDLTKIDFQALQRHFTRSRQRTWAEWLRGLLHRRLRELVHLNKTRMDYLARFQQMIDEYNEGAINADLFLTKLLAFAKELTEEEQRGLAEQLTEEELAIFDILTKPEIELTKAEIKTVKEVARSLLETLQKKLVLDWRKRQQTRAAVRLVIEEKLDQLPQAYSKSLFEEKAGRIYQHVYESYAGAGQSIYASAVS